MLHSFFSPRYRITATVIFLSSMLLCTIAKPADRPDQESRICTCSDSYKSWSIETPLNDYDTTCDKCHAACTRYYLKMMQKRDACNNLPSTPNGTQSIETATATSRARQQRKSETPIAFASAGDNCVIS